jgi:hypothetical protein
MLFADGTGVLLRGIYYTENPGFIFKFLHQQKNNAGQIIGRIFLYACSITYQLIFMRSILYIIAVILIIGWLLGVFAWNAGGLIHILIVLAVISLLLGIIRRA